MATMTSMDNNRMNPQQANILEEARLRKISIQNMQRDNLEAKSIWRDKQVKAYGNLLSITEPVSLAKIITDETQAESQSDFLVKQNAMANLNTIADQNNAEYIIDRLTDDQMKYMNDNWLQIMRKIRKNSSRMDKNAFVNSIIKLSEGSGENYVDMQNEVDRPAITARKEAKERDTQRVVNSLERSAARQDAEMARQQEEGLRLNLERGRANIRARAADLVEPFRNTRARVGVELAEAQRVALNEAVLLARREALRDSTLNRDAGGNQIRPDPLGMGNAAYPPMRAPPSITPAKKSAEFTPLIGSSDIEEVFNLPEITEQDIAGYGNELRNIQTSAENMSAYKLKSEVNKMVGNNKLKEFRTTMNISKLKPATYKELYILATFNKIKNALPPADGSSSSSGRGLKKRIIRGRGYVKHEHKTVKPQRHYIGNAYYVDMNKLHENILSVKYASNDAVIPSSKNQIISDKTKEMVIDILGDKFDDRIFKLLTAEEKRVIKRFIKAVKLDISTTDDDDKEFQRQFEIVRGEYLSGNDSPEIKATLKRYVIEAMKENKMPKHEGFSLIYTLSI